VKTASDELFQLISNLSLSEKRYCALYLQKHSGEENRYARLFEILSKATAYNTTNIQQKLELLKKPAHYAVLKKQLYEQVLDALHQYDLFSNPEQQLMRGIHQCHLLLQKGLFAQCEKRINKLLKDAAEMNHYEARLQLQNLKMMMKARKYYRHETEADLKNWDSENQNLLHELEVTFRYRYLSSRVYKMQYEAGGRGKELAAAMSAIVSLPEFTTEKNATTIRARLDFFQVNALYHFTNGETEKAASYNKQFLHLLEANPLLMQLHADRYFSVLNNYLIDCLILKDYETLENGLTQMRGLQKLKGFRRLVNFEANVFRLGYLLEMNYLISLGRFTDLYGKLNAAKNGLEQYGEKVVKHNRITLYYLMAYTCFAVNKYDEALDYLFPVIQEKETAVAQEVQVAAKMLQLLCHFEKGDMLLADSLVKAVRRILKKDETAEAHRIVLTFINAAVNKREITVDKWNALQKKIQVLSGTKSAAAFNLFNYPVWVQAHVSGKPFETVWQLQ
jgi:hypothetical protein